MDRLCGEVGLSREDIVPGPVCKKCFQDLEKLTKAQTTVDLLRARFLGYIRVIPNQFNKNFQMTPSELDETQFA